MRILAIECVEKRQECLVGILVVGAPHCHLFEQRDKIQDPGMAFIELNAEYFGLVHEAPELQLSKFLDAINDPASVLELYSELSKKDRVKIAHKIQQWLDRLHFVYAAFVDLIWDSAQLKRLVEFGHPMVMWTYDHAGEAATLCRLALILRSSDRGDGKGKRESVPVSLIRVPRIIAQLIAAAFPVVEELHAKYYAELPEEYAALYPLEKSGEEKTKK